jgi:uncharacterized membrane protein (UPF0127 family)
MSASRKLSVAVKPDGRVLSKECTVAASFRTRLIGLLNHSELARDESLLLEPCNQVHSMFMRFPIDVVFLSKENTVIAVSELKPWRMTKIHFKASRVLELPLGRCRELNLKPGDQLEMKPCFS